MTVKVLVYGYATGVFSTRRIARKLHEDMAFRMLAAGNFPAHRTIRDFRALHLKGICVPVRLGLSPTFRRVGRVVTAGYRCGGSQ